MALFPLGKLVATPLALEAIAQAGEDPQKLLHRHVNGDWGQLDGADQAANDAAIRDGGRILSAYRLCTCVKIWIITEAENGQGDRESTCILLPEEY
jgi:hypothetical protein